MTKHGGTRLSLVEARRYLISTTKLKVLQQSLGRDGKQFDGLEEIVEKPMVEPLLYMQDLCGGFLGEGCLQVATHDTATVTHHVIGNGEEQVAHHIHHPQRQQRQDVEHSIDNLITDILHQLCISWSFL